MMKVSRHRGATLALIAAVAVLLIIIGGGLYWIVMIMGGSREMSSAASSGTLNVAKQALVNPSVPAPNEFKDLASGGKINLLNFNACVGKTLLIAYNARAMAQPTALSNASQEVDALHALGKQLKDGLARAERAQGDFESVSLANNTRMYTKEVAGAKFDLKAYETSCVNPSASTNLAFVKGQFPDEAQPPGSAWSSDFQGPKWSGNTGKYLAGYVPIEVANVGTITGVPVFPQQQPHLVSGKDFDAGKKGFGDHVPPNAFHCGSAGANLRSGTMGGASSYSVVGANGDSAEMPAAIPGGYIEFTNLPGVSLKKYINWKFKIVPNQGNIFNNELLAPPGILSCDSTRRGAPVQVFASGAAVDTLQQWVDWVNDGKTGPKPSSVAGIYVAEATTLSAGGRGLRVNQLSDPVKTSFVESLESITHSENLYDELCAGGLSTNAQKWLLAYEAAYHPLPKDDEGGGVTLPDQPIYTAVDVAKAGILDAFQRIRAKNNLPPLNPYALFNQFDQPINNLNNFTPITNPLGNTFGWLLGSPALAKGLGPGNGSTGTNPPPQRAPDPQAQAQQQAANQSTYSETYLGLVKVGAFDCELDGSKVPKTGMGWLPKGVNARYPVPAEYSLPIEQTGTVWQLMEQVGMSRDDMQKVMAQLHQRALQMRPDLSTPGQVDQLLRSTQIPLGTTLYLYVSGSRPGKLVLSAQKPPTYSGKAPDGGPSPTTSCQHKYTTLNTLVNTSTGGRGMADENVQFQPYFQWEARGGEDLYAMDTADWTLASGYDNILGRLEFSNRMGGGDMFSHPN